MCPTILWHKFKFSFVMTLVGICGKNHPQDWEGEGKNVSYSFQDGGGGSTHTHIFQLSPLLFGYTWEILPIGCPLGVGGGGDISSCRSRSLWYTYVGQLSSISVVVGGGGRHIFICRLVLILPNVHFSQVLEKFVLSRHTFDKVNGLYFKCRRFESQLYPILFIGAFSLYCINSSVKYQYYYSTSYHPPHRTLAHGYEQNRIRRACSHA